jgi:hypothetical protein
MFSTNRHLFVAGLLSNFVALNQSSLCTCSFLLSSLTMGLLFPSSFVTSCVDARDDAVTRRRNVSCRQFCKAIPVKRRTRARDLALSRINAILIMPVSVKRVMRTKPSEQMVAFRQAWRERQKGYFRVQSVKCLILHMYSIRPMERETKRLL